MRCTFVLWAHDLDALRNKGTHCVVHDDCKLVLVVVEQKHTPCCTGRAQTRPCCCGTKAHTVLYRTTANSSLLLWNKSTNRVVQDDRKLVLVVVEQKHTPCSRRRLETRPCCCGTKAHTVLYRTTANSSLLLWYILRFMHSSATCNATWKEVWVRPCKQRSCSKCGAQNLANDSVMAAWKGCRIL